MASVSELLGYTGNAALGAGSNPQIPVTSGSSEPLEFTNSILRDIGAREHQKNIIRYQQKINDRDKMMQALSDGSVKTGDLLDRDMPTVRTALDSQTNAFRDWMKKGYGDIDGAIAYRKATQSANEAVTQAQARKLFYDKENQAMASEPIPKFANARKGALENNLKNFWGDLVPFQETTRLDLNPIEKFSTPTTEQFSDPNKPLYKGSRTYYSFGNALENATKYSLTPEGLQNLSDLHNSFMELPPIELMSKVRTINQDLNRYNTERGLKAGDKDYAEPVQVVQLQNGKLSVNEPLDRLAAKISLAGQKQYKSETLDVDKGAIDIAALKEKTAQDKAKNAIDWYEAKTGRINANRLGAAAKVSNEVANSALYYAKGVFDKLDLLKDKNGFISGDALKKLTTDEIKYLGTATTTDNKFSLTPIEISDGTSIKVNDDGTIQIGTGGGKNWLGREIPFTPDATVQKKTVALNKLGDEMTQTTGKEGYNFNTLTPLYEAVGLEGQQDKGAAINIPGLAPINISDIPVGTKLQQKGGKNYYNGREVIIQ